VLSQKETAFHSNVIPVKKNKILRNEGEKFNIKRQVSGVYIFFKKSFPPLLKKNLSHSPPHF